ncbi:MAG: hypothetical protein COB65_10980 [Thalassobium sp.]|nr:MAG: hypothetical protein COB65_10980 [Thalassobium sp.]
MKNLILIALALCIRLPATASTYPCIVGKYKVIDVKSNVLNPEDAERMCEGYKGTYEFLSDRHFRSSKGEKDKGSTYKITDSLITIYWPAYTAKLGKCIPVTSKFVIVNQDKYDLVLEEYWDEDTKVIIAFERVKSKEPPVDVVWKFNSSYNKRDHDGVLKVLHPALTVIDHEGIVVFLDKHSYFASAVIETTPFGTKWKIESMETKGNTVITVESDSSLLNDFAYGGPLQMTYAYEIDRGQIIQLSYSGFDDYEELQSRAVERFKALWTWAMRAHPKKMNTVQSDTSAASAAVRELITEFMAREK